MARVTTGRTVPSNRALAEALFTLADQERPGDRRVDLLEAGYRALDARGPAAREVLGSAPAWLKPLVAQLVACHGEGALTAAVERLGAGRRLKRRPSRERFLSWTEVETILASSPEDLRPQRMRGAFHWHTRDSDGRGSLETMARACRRRGASWAVVSDHSKGLEVASGLDREGVLLQRRRVRRWNDQYGEELRLFQGLEVEILEDGTVDVPRVERDELDLVIAAVHRRLDPGPDQTERLLRAVETPGVRVLAHPRGRLFQRRQGIRARWETVFAACAGRGVLIEINGFPRRQDPDWELTRLAAECGCNFVLASDGHAVAHLEYDAFACAIAARAGLAAKRILNFARREAVEDWIGELGNELIPIQES